MQEVRLPIDSLFLCLFTWPYFCCPKYGLFVNTITLLFRYYPALKTLEQLEHTYLPRVSKYRFSQVQKYFMQLSRNRRQDNFYQY